MGEGPPIPPILDNTGLFYTFRNKELIKENKSSIHPPFDPESYIVMEIKVTQVTARQGGREKRKKRSQVKLVKERPAHLQTRTSLRRKDSDSDIKQEEP